MRMRPYGPAAVYVDGFRDRAAQLDWVARVVAQGLDVASASDAVAVASPYEAFAHVAPDEAAIPAPLHPREHRIDVVYDGADLEALAHRTGLSADAVVKAHASPTYEVDVVGFLPGFGYLKGLDERLVVPRRASPRTRVPAGAVGIAGRYAGVYPSASPGGWHLVGRAIQPALFDPHREPPARLRIGDHVRFDPIRAEEAPSSELHAAPPLPSAEAALQLVKSPPFATLQDGGRPGYASDGVGRGGPLVPGLLARANLALGNPPYAPAIELALAGTTLVTCRKVRLAFDDGTVVRLDPGQTLRVPSPAGFVRYVAIDGGFTAPLVLGSSSTHSAAGFGGHAGRLLRKGDVVAAPMIASSDHASVTASWAGEDIDDEEGDVDRAAPIDLFPGPHLDRFDTDAFERLIEGSYTVSAQISRVGVRLEGPSVRRRDQDLAGPMPMVLGAMQIATDGTPIVLGPDHAVTGGYPVLAVVAPASLARLFTRRPGSPVRFRRASISGAG